MDIKRFDQFFESKGIALATLPISNIVCEEVFKYLSFAHRKNHTKYSLVHIPRSVRSEKGWKSFPVSKVEVKTTLEWIDDEVYNSRYPITSEIKRYNSFGSCADYADASDPDYVASSDTSILQKDGTLYLRIEAGVYFSNNFNESELEGLKMELESTILHELNHAYEGYQLFLKKLDNSDFGGAIPTGITVTSDINVHNYPKEIWTYWSDEFTLLFYWADPHEVRAMVQEALPYVKKYSPSELESKSPSMRYCKYMLKFDKDKFLSGFSKVVKKSLGEDVDPLEVLKKIKNGFADELTNYNSEYNQVSSLSGTALKNMTIDQFLDYSEVRIHRAGEKIRKGILKLYTHDLLRR